MIPNRDLGEAMWTLLWFIHHFIIGKNLLPPEISSGQINTRPGHKHVAPFTEPPHTTMSDTFYVFSVVLSRTLKTPLFFFDNLYIKNIETQEHDLFWDYTAGEKNSQNFIASLLNSKTQFLFMWLCCQVSSETRELLLEESCWQSYWHHPLTTSYTVSSVSAHQHMFSQLLAREVLTSPWR